MAIVQGDSELEAIGLTLKAPRAKILEARHNW